MVAICQEVLNKLPEQKALQVLRDLSDVTELGDFVYDIRDRESLGWTGPLVTKWGNACVEAKKLLKFS